MEPALVLAAAGVAATHLALVAFLLTGGFLALRYTALLRCHLASATAVVAVNLLGMSCPLTALENTLREAAGLRAYAGGFIEHYLVLPLTGGGLTPGLQSVMQALVFGAVAVPLALRLNSLGRAAPRPRTPPLTLTARTRR